MASEQVVAHACRHGQGRRNAPVVLDAECVGRVAEAGSGVVRVACGRVGVAELLRDAGLEGGDRVEVIGTIGTRRDAGAARIGRLPDEQIVVVDVLIVVQQPQIVLAERDTDHFLCVEGLGAQDVGLCRAERTNG
ncbi:hypothetical protein D9M73_121370 [compost metagenome]